MCNSESGTLIAQGKTRVYRGVPGVHINGPLYRAEPCGGAYPFPTEVVQTVG